MEGDFVSIEEFRGGKGWQLTVVNFGCLALQLSALGLLLYQTFNESVRFGLWVNVLVFAVIVAMGVLIIVVSRRMGCLLCKCDAVGKLATHIEWHKASDRRMRKVMKDGKMGLVDEATFSLVLPIEYEEISYMCNGNYYTVTLPGGMPERYNEIDGF